MHHIYAQSPEKSKRALNLLNRRGGCEFPSRCWELNPGHLEEQQVLLTTEPCLQPLNLISLTSKEITVILWCQTQQSWLALLRCTHRRFILPALPSEFHLWFRAISHFCSCKFRGSSFYLVEEFTSAKNTRETPIKRTLTPSQSLSRSHLCSSL